MTTAASRQGPSAVNRSGSNETIALIDSGLSVEQDSSGSSPRSQVLLPNQSETSITITDTAEHRHQVQS